MEEQPCLVFFFKLFVSFCFLKIFIHELFSFFLNVCSFFLKNFIFQFDVTKVVIFCWKKKHFTPNLHDHFSKFFFPLKNL